MRTRRDSEHDSIDRWLVSLVGTPGRQRDASEGNHPDLAGGLLELMTKKRLGGSVQLQKLLLGGHPQAGIGATEGDVVRLDRQGLLSRCCWSKIRRP